MRGFSGNPIWNTPVRGCLQWKWKSMSTCTATLLAGHTYSWLALSAASLSLTLQALSLSRTVFALRSESWHGNQGFSMFLGVRLASVPLLFFSSPLFFPLLCSFFHLSFSPSLLPEKSVSSTLFMPDSSLASSSSSSSAHVLWRWRFLGWGSLWKQSVFRHWGMGMGGRMQKTEGHSQFCTMIYWLPN